MVRELEIMGFEVTVCESGRNPGHTYDYTGHAEQLKNLLQLLRQQQKPLLVVVYGRSGCGKTMLARALTKNATNAEYVDCLAISPLKRDKDFKNMLSNVEVTYLLDEPDDLDSSIWSSVDQHVTKGGICIVFAQDLERLQVKSEYKALELTRQALTCH